MLKGVSPREGATATSAIREPMTNRMRIFFSPLPALLEVSSIITPEAENTAHDFQSCTNRGPITKTRSAETLTLGRLAWDGWISERRRTRRPSSVRRSPPDCLDPKIHHANLIPSILAKIEANNAGADDALMLDVRGFVAETNATHVFIVSCGKVLTGHTVACPEGITRATVLDLCHKNDIPHGEKDVSLTEVYRADEVFCTGTMGELAGVVKVDGRTIGAGCVGPMTLRLSALYQELTQSEGFAIV